jgi:enoyl-CoA hydratase/carnithine racemase
MTFTNSDIHFDSHGNGVFEIRLNRPERMNALGVATVIELRRAVAQAREQRARVLLIRGTGRAFCAGADLKERKSMDLPERLAHNAAINDANNEIAAAKCVTIAVMNGIALGGGLEMALACDLRLAADGISVGLTESRVGAFPGAGGTQRLARTIGASRALQMMLTGEPVSSSYAAAIGLVNEVVSPERLEARAHELANLLAGRSAPALHMIKQLVYQGIELPLRDGLQLERAAVAQILGSDDYAEGLAAFAEGRPPRFTGIVEA